MTKKKKRTRILVVGIFIAIFGSFLAFKILSPSEPLVVIGNTQMETILSSKEEKKVFVYIGRPTCPECQKFEPILKETLKGEYKTIYYYNTDVARKDNEESLESLAFELGVKVVPTMIKISNGKVVSKLAGIKNQKAILEFLN